MKKYLKVLAAVLSVATIGTAATACTNKNGSSEENAKGSITVQVFENDSGAGKGAWSAIANEFEKESGIKVNLSIGSNVNTYWESYWQEGVNVPDMIWIDGDGLKDANMVASGKFYDLKEWLETTKVYGENVLVKDVINTELIEDYSGKNYELPIMANCYGLYYDKDYFAENNITAPTNYDELVALGKGGMSSGFTYPGKNAASYSTWSTVMTSLAAYEDDEFFSKLCLGKDKSVWDDPRVADVFTRYRNYCKSYAYGNTATQDHLAAQNNVWKQHKALFIANGMWLEKEAKPTFNMGVALSPFNLATQKTTLLVVPKKVAVAQRARNREGALQFLSFFYKASTQKMFTEGYCFLSALKNYDYSSSDVSEVTKQVYDAVLSEANNVVYKNKDWGDLGTQVNNAVNGLVTGKYATAADAINYIKSQI